MKRTWQLCGVAVLALLPAMASAQTAKITAVVLDVKCRASAAAGWAPARVGRTLGAGAQVRTGKRGKCEIKFPDGSLIRLAPLSDLTIARVAGKDLSMGYGKLYARIVKGTTTRIQGGTGVASIKGTILEFDAGALAEARERTTNVLTIFDGLAELSGGGQTREVHRGSQSEIGADGTPGNLHDVPDESFFGMTGEQWWNGVVPGSEILSTPGSFAGLDQRDENQEFHSPTLGAQGWFPLHQGSVVVDLQSVRPGAAARMAQAVAPMLSPDIALDMPPVAMIQTDPAQAFGKRFYGPDTRVDLFGLAGTDRNLAGIRVRPCVVWNDLYFEVGGMAWTRTDEAWRTELSEGFVKARPRWGDITVGRQHFTLGPVNNSNLGTIIGFDTADAVRWQPRLGPVRFDMGYVTDYLPLEDDTLRGYYSRAEASVLRGTMGINTVHYNHIGTGVSLDFSVPVIPGEWDVYGEFGSDPVNKRVETFGTYFPGLYNRTNVDLFVEYAHREGQGQLWTAKAYRNFDQDWTGVLSLLASSKDDAAVSLGVIKRFQ